jgi:phosphoribosylformylglycinamidine synthase
LKIVHGAVRGVPPQIDLAAERSVQALLVEAVARDLIVSAHDCSEGGVAIALAECCFGTGGLGMVVDIPIAELADVNNASAERDAPASGLIDATLFGESASRVIVSVEPSALARFLTAAADAAVPARRIGRTGGSRIQIAVDGVQIIDLGVNEAEQIWETAIEGRFASRVA